VSGGPLAFYAPLKAPDDATPSGDRRMARLFLAALERAGYRPEIASRIRTFDGSGDKTIQARLRAEGEREAERLVAAYGALAPAQRPRAWFTYHVYYKATGRGRASPQRSASPMSLRRARAHPNAPADRGPWATRAPSGRWTLHASSSS